jgi:hypothetical protein
LKSLLAALAAVAALAGTAGPAVATSDLCDRIDCGTDRCLWPDCEPPPLPCPPSTPDFQIHCP